MASAWHIAAMGWGVTVLGWLLSPIIGLLLNKILSYLGFDASQKLRDLEIHTIPELKRTLREVEEQRMLRAARKEISNVDILDKLATMLRSVLYEAEDILDLIDYHQIEKKVIGDGESHDNSWLQWWVQRLYDAVGTGFARCNRSWMGRCRSAALLRWARQSLCWLGRCVRAALHRSAALLPISCPPLVSLSSVQRIRCWSGSFDFNNCCRSIFVWLRSRRDWSYHEVGITSYQVLYLTLLLNSNSSY